MANLKHQSLQTDGDTDTEATDTSQIYDQCTRGGKLELFIHANIQCTKHKSWSITSASGESRKNDNLTT